MSYKGLSRFDDSDIERVLGLLSDVCHRHAVGKGFYDAHNELVQAVSSGLFTKETRERLLAEVMVTATLTRHALIDSETAEATEGVRKNTMSDKIPEFTSQEEEMADALIRICDYAGWLGLRLGPAVLAKMTYNTGRPKMHGGKKA